MRDAVAASVTYPAPSRASSQVSVVVTTPSAVRFSRSQVIFGAAKYGSSGSPVIAASRGRPESRSQRRRSSILPNDGRGQRPSRPAVPGQHGLALVGQRIAWTGARAWPRARVPAPSTDRYSSSGSCSTPPSAVLRGSDRFLGRPEHLVARARTSAFVAEVPWSIARMFIGPQAARPRPGPPCRRARPRRARLPRSASRPVRGSTARCRPRGRHRARRARSTGRRGTPWDRSG